MVVNGTSNVVNYGTCSTAAGTAAKVVSCSNFALITGSEITVKFTTTNTAANPTLNVNSTGAKAIYYRGSAISAGYLAANRTYTFRYNGSQYELVGDLNTNTTYSAGTGLSLSGTTFNHSNSVTAGTAKGDDSKTLGFGSTFAIPTVTYDAQGHITGKGTTTMTMPANPNVDTKVTQAAAITTAGEYPVILGYSTATTAVTNTVNKASTLTYNPSTKVLTTTTFKGSLTGNASSASKLATARTIQTNLGSTSSASFNGSANITPGVTGTLPVANGGTGTTTFTSGAALIGNGTGAVSTRSITNMTSVGYINFNTNLMTTNTLAYWNGAYNSSGTSNLAYCIKGAFGTAATKGVDTTATSGSGNLITSGAMYTALAGKAPSSHTHSYLPLSGGSVTGVITSTYKSGTWLNSLTNSAITLSDAASSYGGWICGPTKDGRIAISTYQANSNILYFGYGERGRTANSFAQTMTWDGANNILSAGKVYGAVWNDYAEYRICKDNFKPGQAVLENGNDTLSITNKRLQRGCSIVSDTYGFAIGETEEAKCPIAISGRVLAYPYEPIEEFAQHIGWPVCSGPNGTVSIMTEEEEEKYPSRIIGTISAVPDYEEWGTGKVKVDGRVWIKVK